MNGKLPESVQTCLGSHHTHIQVGRDLSRELVQPPAQGRVNTTQMKLLRTLISSVLKTYSNQDSTVSPNNWLHGLNYPHREFSFVYPIGISHVSIYKHPVNPLFFVEILCGFLGGLVLGTSNLPLIWVKKILVSRSLSYNFGGFSSKLFQFTKCFYTDEPKPGQVIKLCCALMIMKKNK